MRIGEPKRMTNLRMCLAVAALSLICLQLPARAARAKIKISDLKQNWVRTPQFRDTSNSAASSENQWLQFEVKYDSSGGRNGWIDTVTIDWVVLMKPVSGKPMLMKRRVVYSDIEEGTHHAVVYLRPRFLQRYTGRKTPEKKRFAVYVAIRANGERMDRKVDTRMRLPKDWYRRGEPDVRVVENELLPRTKTPFAPMDYDFYEHIMENTP